MCGYEEMEEFQQLCRYADGDDKPLAGIGLTTEVSKTKAKGRKHCVQHSTRWRFMNCITDYWLNTTAGTEGLPNYERPQLLVRGRVRA